MSIYSADFETTTAKISTEWTRVWLYAYSDISKHYDDTQVHYGFTIESFIDEIESNFIDGDIIYFHNLKFDGSFIINELLRRGYTREQEIKKSATYQQFTTMISDLGVWYQIEIRSGFDTVTIRNSLCLIANSVRNIGEGFNTRLRKQEIEYDDAALTPSEVTPLQLDYITADVQIMAEVLNTLINDYGFTHLTAGSCAIHDYIDRIGGDKAFRKLFPTYDYYDRKTKTRDVHIDDFLRQAYRGGWCYVNALRVSELHHKNAPLTALNPFRIYTDGQTFDVNSLYPSVMHSASGNIYPVGKPEHFKGLPEAIILQNAGIKRRPRYPLWIAKIRCSFSIKENKYPCIQLKKSGIFADNEWLCNSRHIDEVSLQFTDIVELTISSVDFGLMSECYEMDNIEFIEGYQFQGLAGLFDDYINHWYDIKSHSKGARKQLAKIMLNSFYGKFATRLKGRSKIPTLENERIKFDTIEDNGHKPYYLPVGIFVTAYARKFTITAANANYDRFVYADTDSIHMTGQEPPKAMKVSATDLLAWKRETTWTDGVFVRQKTYMEYAHERQSDPYEWNIRCCGMPDSMRYDYELDSDGNPLTNPDGSAIRHIAIDPDDFKPGLRITEGKLIARQVKGGVVLMDTPFEIKT